MRQRTAGEAEAAGRHRSPWGRSNRILPIRWGRIITAIVGVIAVVTSLVLIRGGGSEPPAAGSDPAAAATTMVTPTEEATPPSPEPTAAGTAGASPAPATAGPSGPSAPADAVAPPPAAGSPARGTAATRPATVPSAGGGGDGRPRPASGPAINLSSDRVAFGDVESTISVDLVGVGTAPARVRVGETPAWLSVVPRRDVVDPGARVPLVVTLNRATAPPGPVNLAVRIAPVEGSGGGDLRITGTVSGAPELTVSVTPSELVAGPCPTGTTQAAVNATVVDPTGVFGVELRLRAQDGAATTTPLNLGTTDGDRSTWTGQLGPTPATGDLAYTVVATDLDGRRSERAGTVEVRPCPGG